VAESSFQLREKQTSGIEMWETAVNKSGEKGT
jgi:hypothetical protein